MAMELDVVHRTYVRARSGRTRRRRRATIS
jgi:hypothetical protein